MLPNVLPANTPYPHYCQISNVIKFPLISIDSFDVWMEASICSIMLKYGYTIKKVREIRRLPNVWTKKAISSYIKNKGIRIYKERITGANQLLQYEDNFVQEFRITLNEIEKERGLSTIQIDYEIFDSIDSPQLWLHENKGKYPNLNFWIKKIVWKKPKHAAGYIQYSLRPYTQGYGCDGTTTSNILYITQCFLKKKNIDILKILNEAYPDEKFNLNFRLNTIESETFIPNTIDSTLIIEDLHSINYHTFAVLVDDIIMQF